MNSRTHIMKAARRTPGRGITAKSNANISSTVERQILPYSIFHGFWLWEIPLRCSRSPPLDLHSWRTVILNPLVDRRWLDFLCVRRVVVAIMVNGDVQFKDFIEQWQSSRLLRCGNQILSYYHLFIVREMCISITIHKNGMWVLFSI